jgi:hypothetical protein
MISLHAYAGPFPPYPCPDFTKPAPTTKFPKSYTLKPIKKWFKDMSRGIVKKTKGDSCLPKVKKQKDKLKDEIDKMNGKLRKRRIEITNKLQSKFHEGSEYNGELKNMNSAMKQIQKKKKKISDLELRLESTKNESVIDHLKRRITEEEELLKKNEQIIDDFIKNDQELVSQLSSEYGEDFELLKEDYLDLIFKDKNDGKEFIEVSSSVLHGIPIAANQESLDLYNSTFFPSESESEIIERVEKKDGKYKIKLTRKVLKNIPNLSLYRMMNSKHSHVTEMKIKGNVPNPHRFDVGKSHDEEDESVETSFLDFYMKSNRHPDLIKIENELSKLYEAYQILDQQYKDVCEGDARKSNSCELMQNQFRLNPSQENFEKMISTVDGVVYADLSNKDGAGNAQAYKQTLTVDTYPEFINKVKDKTFLVGKDKLKKIKVQYKAAKKAMEEYKKSKESIDSTLPSNFKSVCGGCRDIKKNFQNAIKSKDIELIAKYREIDKITKCNIISKEVEDCEKEISNTLRRSSLFGSVKSDQLLTLEKAFDKIKENPTYQSNINRFQNAYSKISTMVSTRDDRVKSCVDCDFFMEKINDLTTGDDSSLKLKDSTQSDLFKTVRELAVKNSCLSPDDKRIELNSCEEKISYFKEVSEFSSSVDSKKLNENMKFIQDNNCCSQILSSLPTRGKYLQKDDEQFRLAKAMGCIKCAEDKNDFQKVDDSNYQNPHVSCEFYSKHIRNKTDGDSISNLNKPNHGGEYKVSEFKENEIYVCKEGPQKSLINRNRDWETKAYSEHGKYGVFSNLDLKCFIDPATGESVNLSCCNLVKEDPYFKDLVEKLENDNTKITQQDFESISFENDSPIQATAFSDAINQMNKKSGVLKARTFCQDIFAKLQQAKVESETDSWEVCTDIQGNQIWAVDNLNLIDTKIDVKSSVNSVREE